MMLIASSEARPSSEIPIKATLITRHTYSRMLHDACARADAASGEEMAWAILILKTGESSIRCIFRRGVSHYELKAETTAWQNDGDGENSRRPFFVITMAADCDIKAETAISREASLDNGASHCKPSGHARDTKSLGQRYRRRR